MDSGAAVSYHTKSPPFPNIHQNSVTHEMQSYTSSDIETLNKLPQNVQADILWLVQNSVARRNRELEIFNLQDPGPAHVVLLPPRPRPAIFKPDLPPELMTMILDQLDISTLRSFSLVNSACLPMVKNIRRYQELLTNVPHFFKALHQSIDPKNPGQIVTYEKLFDLIGDGECTSCGAFAPFIFTIDSSRACFQCLRRGGCEKNDFNRFKVPEQEELLAEIAEAPSQRFIRFSAIPGTNQFYLPISRRVPYYGATPASIGLEAANLRAHDEKSAVMRKRFEYAIFAPTYDKEIKFWDYGLSCAGCAAVSELDLISGGVGALLRHMVNCDRAVTKFWEEKKEILNSLWEYSMQEKG